MKRSDPQLREDIKALQAKVWQLERELAAEKAKPPVEVVKEVVRRVPEIAWRERVKTVVVEKPVEVIREVERLVEVVKEVPRIIHVQAPAPDPIQIIKTVEVPIERIKIVRVPDEIRIAELQAEIDMLRRELSAR